MFYSFINILNRIIFSAFMFYLKRAFSNQQPSPIVAILSAIFLNEISYQMDKPVYASFDDNKQVSL